MENSREDSREARVEMLLNEITQLGCEVQKNYSMSRYTWLRVGGEAGGVVYPSTLREFTDVLSMASEHEVPWVVLGAGSNTIVYDEGIEGVVICTKKLKRIEILEGDKVLAETGAILGTILNQTVKAGLTGFEFAAGIPGTVGGGVYMNAGANNGEIKDVIDTVWVWREGREYEYKRSEINFEYRKSNLPEGSVVTKALFQLSRGDVAQSKRNVKEYMDRRARTQPIKMSNTGSIFKNPSEIAAGRLIEELGLKGYRIGGAEFSEIHANFIVNTGGATAEDVLSLIEVAKKKALVERGIKLETEVKVIGIKKD